jgi:SAM-dependent methyltransferase
MNKPASRHAPVPPPDARARNRDAWDDRVRQKELYAVPAREKDFENPLAVVDQCGWLGGDVKGKRLLCLAAGALVTVVDLSPRMLELDRMMAAKRGLKVNLVEASMDDLSALPGAHFEIVLQPVSTCYVPDIEKVYREVARVMVAGGVYVSQHKQPVSLQVDLAPTPRGYVISEPYHRTGPLPPVVDPDLGHREAGTVEFLHRLEPMLGGLCRAGFVIEDVMEPRHADPKAEPGSFRHRSLFFPPYLKIKARRTRHPADGTRTAKLWVPGAGP